MLQVPESNVLSLPKHMFPKTVINARLQEVSIHISSTFVIAAKTFDVGLIVHSARCNDTAILL